MLEGKLIIIIGEGLFVLTSQCGNNNELALQYGGLCTM